MSGCQDLEQPVTTRRYHRDTGMGWMPIIGHSPEPVIDPKATLASKIDRRKAVDAAKETDSPCRIPNDGPLQAFATSSGVPGRRNSHSSSKPTYIKRQEGHRERVGGPCARVDIRSRPAPSIVTCNAKPSIRQRDHVRTAQATFAQQRLLHQAVYWWNCSVASRLPGRTCRKNNQFIRAALRRSAVLPIRWWQTTTLITPIRAIFASQ